MAEYTVVTSDFINVSITSSGQKNCIERRFQKGITIDDFKVYFVKKLTYFYFIIYYK